MDIFDYCTYKYVPNILTKPEQKAWCKTLLWLKPKFWESWFGVTKQNSFCWGRYESMIFEMTSSPRIFNFVNLCRWESASARYKYSIPSRANDNSSQRRGGECNWGNHGKVYLFCGQGGVENNGIHCLQAICFVIREGWVRSICICFVARERWGTVVRSICFVTREGCG